MPTSPALESSYNNLLTAIATALATLTTTLDHAAADAAVASLTAATAVVSDNATALGLDPLLMSSCRALQAAIFDAGANARTAFVFKSS